MRAAASGSEDLAGGRALAVAARMLLVDSIRREQEVRVATKTTEDTLAEIRRHIDELEARADDGVVRAHAHLRDRLDLLHEEEASAWTAVRDRAEVVDEKLRRLELEVAIAESRLAAEIADDLTVFTESVEAELDDWDVAIERLQTRAAAMAHDVRVQAEAVIAELRRARNRASNCLKALRASSHDGWQEKKGRVTDALDDLERNVREAAATYPLRRKT